MMEQLAVELIQSTEESVAQSHGAADDRVEDRLHTGLRAADDMQYLSGRRLLLQRLGEVAVARLQLLEEADVLDGDYGFVGEGLEERDLGVREWLDLRPADSDHADRYIVAQEWYGQDRLHTVLRRRRLWKLPDGLRHVTDVDRLAIDHRSTHGVAPT